MAESCVVCHEAVDDGRCVHCGAARAPGGYVVRRLVAQTPHSRLYLADAPDGSQVALKELLFSQVPGVKELEAFEREAALLKELTHPQVPRFVGSFQEGRGVGTRLYLAQEFVPGGSLADRLKSRRFSESEARDVARQLLRILEALHARVPMLVHRDLKPANVLFRADGTLVLVDFGAARTLENDATHRSTLVGTFGYMPPEQLGGTVDATSDLYALGATLLHLVSGKSPADLAGGDLALDVVRHVKASKPFVAWLQRMVARHREDRFPGATAALEALDAPPPVVTEPARSESNPAVAIAWVLGVLVLALGGGVLGFLQKEPEPTPVAAIAPSGETSAPTEAPEGEKPGVSAAEPPRAHPPNPAPSTNIIRDDPRPRESPPGVEVVKLTRVQASGARKAFFVGGPLSFDPRLDVTVPPEAACRESPKIVLDRVAIRPDGERARWLLAVGVEVPDERCREVRMNAHGTDGLSVTSTRTLAAGTPLVTLDVPLNQPVVEWSLGPPSKAVVVRLDAEKRTAVVLPAP